MNPKFNNQIDVWFLWQRRDELGFSYGGGKQNCTWGTRQCRRERDVGRVGIVDGVVLALCV
jgi:hypothetical protein